jgi:hypothetical protein
MWHASQVIEVNVHYFQESVGSCHSESADPESSAGILKQSMGNRNRIGIGLSYRPARAGIFKKSVGARHRGGIGFSYRPARLHRLAEFIPWNRCRGPIDI